MTIATTDAGVISRVLSQFPVSPSTPDGQMAENVRSAISRGLPEVEPKKVHKHRMAIAAGGPSLADTWRDLDGVICAVNGSLSFLLDRDVKPWACGVFDPRPHMADIVEKRKDVFYFLASTCHPKLFDKLEGCQIGLWHPLGMPGIEDIAEGAKHFIGGGTTMGLRWFNIGYFMGFRDFHAHGLDSSFRGNATHAYPDHTDGQGDTIFMGYRTRLNFLQQVDDFRQTKILLRSMGDEPSIRLFGEGLLQHCEREGLC